MLLKVAATLTVHARQIKVNLGAAANKWWPDLARSPLPTANRVADISWHRGSYPQRIIGNSRESRLPASRKSGSGKLESDKESVKKASKLSKR